MHRLSRRGLGQWARAFSSPSTRRRGAAALSACVQELELRTLLSIAPVANINGPYEGTEGTAIVLSAVGSVDEDGTITKFEWDLDYDGKTFQANYTSTNPATPTYSYTPTDNFATRTIALRATDNEGNVSAIATTTLSVANVPPSLGNLRVTPETLNEGASVTLSGDIVDPSVLDTFPDLAINWGDGPIVHYTPNSRHFSFTHTYRNDGNYTISVSLLDDDGGAGNGAAVVVVSNRVPVPTLTGNDAAIKDQAYELTLNSGDPGLDDLITWTIDWGDGNTETVAEKAASKKVTHTYTTAGQFTVKVKARDEVSGDVAAADKTVKVQPFLITLSGDSSVNEGADPGYRLYFTTSATITGWQIDWGDGSEVSTLQANVSTTTHKYLNGANTYTIKVTGLSASGNAEATRTVTVNNRPPVPVITGDATVIKDRPYTIQLDAKDPGSNDAITWTINWGDGSTDEVVSPTDTDKRGTVTLSHTYTSIRSYYISVTAKDDANPVAQGTANKSVSVVRRFSISGADTVNEGSVYTLNLSTGGEQELQNVGNWSINWGDGSEAELVPYTATSITHTYPTAEKRYLITAEITDIEGAYTTSRNVTVSNAAPQVTVTGATGGVRGQALKFAAAISDPGPTDTHQIKWDFGDGTVIDYKKATGTALRPTHVFKEAKTYKVRAEVRDNDGAITITTQEVTITPLQLQADPLNPGKTMLVVGGTEQAESITINPASAGRVKVLFGKSARGPYAPTGRIVVLGLGGDDTLLVSPKVKKPTLLDGGAGDDSLTGGAGSDILRGGAGNDQLLGGFGRDLLIGGAGADQILGQGGSDILLSGNLTLNTDARQLEILRLWSAPTKIADRIRTLRSSLSATTVRDDRVSDVLKGGAEEDWLLPGKAADTLTTTSGDVTTRF